MNNVVVDRVRSLVGTRFRPQGRDANLGVDCLGLAMLAYDIKIDTVRRDYRLSGDHKRQLMVGLIEGFRRIPRTRARQGDLLLMQVAHRQYHLAVRTDAGFVHADARRGVVETPGAPTWPVVGVYRRRSRVKRGEG